MIQFNLLPDIKIQYLKANRQKHVVLLASVIVIIVSVVLMALLVSYVFVFQKKSISNISDDIKQASSELQGTKDLVKILTVQNQLKSLPALHDAKPVVTRLFTYINDSTPTDISLARVNADYAQNTMTLSGSADSLNTINKFTDTLKFTKYSASKSPSTKKQAFTGVVLANFGRDSKGASFTINLKFDPLIFSQADETKFTIEAPAGADTATTRSETDKPDALFQGTGQ